jgi:hypothetical protein
VLLTITASAQAPAIQVENTKKQILKLPKQEQTTQTTNNGVSADAPTVSSSLVGVDSDLGRQWVTPIIANGAIDNGAANFDHSNKHQMLMVNPDTSKATRVRVTCYDMAGNVANISETQELAPLAAKYFPITHRFNKQGEGIGEGWCHIISSLPIAVQGSDISTRQIKDGQKTLVFDRVRYFVSAK